MRFRAWNKIIFLVCLTCAAHAAAGIAYAAAPSVVTAPRKIHPGDIMTVTVKNSSGAVKGMFLGKRIYFNPSKDSQKAVIGIDLNVEPGKYPLTIAVKDSTITRTVVITKKQYPVQRLSLPENMVVLSPENEARVELEQKKTAAIWPVESEKIWAGNFINPLPGKPLGTPFGVRRVINNIPKNSHSGVDISADEGEPVKAPNDGVVVLVDEQFFSGKSVVIDHGQGIYTMFFHLSEIKVRHGQAVIKGDIIGLVGATGRASGAHLHWGARVQGARADPLQLIKLNLE